MPCIFLFLLLVKPVFVSCASLKQGVIRPEVCETKECQEAAEHIKKWMNPAFKPCEDFYEFSCGYWHSPDGKTENKKHNSSLGSKGDLFDEYLKIFALDDTIERESRMLKMAKQIFDLCLDEESINARGVSPAIQFMRQVGGWPVLEKDWSEVNWDLLRAEIFLGGVFFRFEVHAMFFDFINTLVVFNGPKQSSDQSVPDLSEGLENESVQEYYRKNCDLAELFGAERSKAEEEMKDALRFEMALAELDKTTDGTEMYISYNMSHLQNDIAWVNWTRLITSSLPESVTLAENQSILIVSPAYLKGLRDLINKYPKRTIANYMMSKAASPLKKYLPTSVYNSTGEMNLTRSDFCMNLVKTSSLSGIMASYIARQTIEDQKVATEMTRHILDELLTEVKQMEWLDEKTRSVAIKTLQETNIQISFPEEVLNIETMEELYKDVKLNTSYFFEAAIDRENWVRKEKLRNLGKSMSELSLKDKIDDTLTINAYFMLIGNYMTVTAGFLHDIPLFNSKLPLYINYGHLGSIIAHELTHALDFQTNHQEDRIEDIEPHQLVYRWGSNVTEEIYEEKKQCFIEQYSSFNDSKYTGKMLNGNRTKREDVADNGGLKLALKTYRRLAAQLSEPEPKLTGLEQYSNEQLFIISAANALCEIPTKEKLLKQLKRDSHSPKEFRVKGMMMNLPDFSKMFGCKYGDPMNPVNKCKLW